MKIWRCDLSKQSKYIIEELLNETRDILLSGRYTLGSRLEKFEEEFASYCEVPFTAGVASGTEAIYLALKAHNIGPGDEVLTVPFTFIGTVTAITMTGAKPVFVDIRNDTFNIDAGKIKDFITNKSKAIIPVHLFGQIAEMDTINRIARQAGLVVIEDAAQAHGATYQGRRSGNLGNTACYSFYPSKNLGAYGDAGAIVTHDEALYRKIKLMRNYGQDRLYHQALDGINSRLDELQAAFLSVKLKYLDQWNTKRRYLAELYRQQLHIPGLVFPVEIPESVSNYHVMTIRVEKRDALQVYLETQGIQTNIYYPEPLHLQIPNLHYGYRTGDFPEAERACKEVLALPMYPELEPDTVRYVCKMINSFYLK